jgi:hypothetical protein
MKERKTEGSQEAFLFCLIPEIVEVPFLSPLLRNLTFVFLHHPFQIKTLSVNDLSDVNKYQRIKPWVRMP